MNTYEPEAVDEHGDLEEWLESELTNENEALTAPEGAPVPFKIRWIASDGSHVVENQVLAALSSAQQNEGKDSQPYQVSQATHCDATGDANRGLSRYDGSSHLRGFEHQERRTSSDTCPSTKGSAYCAAGLISSTSVGSVTCRLQLPHDPFLLRSKTYGTLKQTVSTDTLVTDASAVLGTVESLPCSHSVIIHGLCVTCCCVVENPDSKRRKESIAAQAKRQAPDLQASDTSLMVVPGFITNNNEVRVNAKVSNEMELLELLRLLRKRKLCLVLDLDNTLIHSSCTKVPDDIDIAVIDMYGRSEGYKLQFDNEEDNLRYEEELENSILVTRTLNELDNRYFVNYYKLRPGVYKFLRRASELYELYLFTMGTRAHAHAALKILDPSGTFFGHRVFSRSETNNCFKSLCRIFPNYRNLLLILDDSEHIWVDAPGLIKVYPYYYFTDLALIKNRDCRNLGRVSAAMQAHCNYSNYVWHSVIMEIWKDNALREAPVRDYEGFTVPMGLKVPGKCPPTFRYNHLLIANSRPSCIFRRASHAESTSAAWHSREVSNTTQSPDTPERQNLVAETLPLEASFPPSGGAILAADSSPAEDKNRNIKGTNKTVTITPSTHSDDYTEVNPERAPQCRKATTDNATLTQAGSFTRKLRKIYVRDCDQQLPCITKLLCEMHKQFFDQFDNTEVTLEQLKYLIEKNVLPDVGVLLCKHREGILRGVVLAVNRNDFLSARTGEESDFFKTDLGFTARRFGVVKSSVDAETTHYLSNNVSTVVSAPGIKRVHSQWLEACIYTWCHVSEPAFDPAGWKEPFRTFWDTLNAQQS
ncbi:RNA polymerase II subunit A C-terminal domain phosphatase [Babesia sp. Xinjiang]|uniref:RNA polymerase II subunit A C-terminal domain phosphatase n=1 Tax=Babesia sp. Xinjiang TaxID=462227 RepID=UPI000A217F9E|nr:RNA polymerase II subunit A C-terminal domain phosphatase [Babesia sp. Xinjiang]ORM40761.1 RNA polymerase II subunit A C-terminal domain phosphatase [Babesia sp. Xinjiang]